MSPKKYSCHVCNKAYHYQTPFITHIQAHTSHKPYKCSECAQAFRVRSQLREHMKIHSNERPFLCETCGKSFKLLSVLKSHLTIHTGEERYTCSECGKTYRYRASLFAHMQKHTGHRPHKCDQCTAAFRVKTHLRDHLRIHSGEKPFECEICSAKYSRMDSLQKHLKVHIQNGLKVDLISAVHRARLRARAKTRGSPNNQPEPRLSHCSEKEDNRITTENPMMCTDSQPDDEGCVVVTLSSIGDGSNSTNSIEKHRAGSQLSSEIIMRSLPDNNKNSQIHNKIVINSTGSSDYSGKTCANGDGDIKLPVCHDKPDSSQKRVSAKTAISCTPSRHKPYIDIVDIDTVFPKDATPQIVIDKPQTQASGNHARSVDVSQHVESSNNIGRWKKKSKPIYIPIPKKKTEARTVIKEPSGFSEKSVAIAGVSGSKEVETHSADSQEHSLGNTATLREKKSKCGLLQMNACHWIPAHRTKQQPRGVNKGGNIKVDSSGPSPLPLTSPVQHHSNSQEPGHSVKCGKHNDLLPFNSTSKKQTESHVDPSGDICGKYCKMFQKKCNFARHKCNVKAFAATQRHTHNDGHVCDQCGKRFKKRFVLKVHYRKHTGERPFVCRECNKRFISATHRRVHRRLHASVQPLQCPSCRKLYRLREHLEHHLKVCGDKTEITGKGKDDIPSMVTICIQPGHDALVYDVHEQNHLSSADSDPPAQPQHEAHSSTARVKLDYQDNSYETKGVFEAVLEVNESDLSQKNYHDNSTENAGGTCDKSTDDPPECQVQKGNYGLLEEKAAKPPHVRPQGRLKCSYCPKTFNNKSAFTSHEMTHTGEKPFHCSECGKRFSQKNNLQTHTRMHTGERPFLCEYCGRQYSHKYSLKAHRQIHTQERGFECGVCGKHFKHESNRNVHLKRHAGKKDFKCYFCPKAFVTKVDLQDHQRTHTKEKPYKCDQCGRRFAVRHHLTDHYKLHRVTGPYKCQLCIMSFVHVWSWKKHIETHTHLMKETFH